MDRLKEIKERDAFSLNETEAEQDRRWLLNELRKRSGCADCGSEDSHRLGCPQRYNPLGLDINR